MYYMILSSKKMTSWKKLAELVTVPYNIPHFGFSKYPFSIKNRTKYLKISLRESPFNSPFNSWSRILIFKMLPYGTYSSYAKTGLS